jgi:hypothetical protein
LNDASELHLSKAARSLESALVDAWSDRVVGDYEVGTAVPSEAAAAHVERAEQMLAAIRDHLRPS